MHGLVLGRFQPLHKGHEALIRQAMEDCVEVTVAIGSATAKQSAKDPFTLEERMEMVRAVFGDRLRVIAVPDIHDPPRYADHVAEITGRFERVFGNDDRTVDLFEDAGYQVRRPGLVEREKYEGAIVRLQIAEGDGGWRKAVSPPVAALLEQWDAGVRLRRLEAML